LCVRCVLPRDVGGLGSYAVFVDGGNSFSPYLIVDADYRSPNNRVRAAELLSGRQRFDTQRYLEMLLEAGETLFSVFGYNLERIRSIVVYGEKQLILG